ncbi:MAG: nitroreductase family deazaflavin-dependent oxidoreductase [Acidimicrobiia bacterium]|nr:nitroreductase family deazaflavin-dependent oxidoreductase [Acidimicrobiia bacterium]NNF10389.1 nitroreductase family deazaflavin-dependent oxidoreductase [Acidimicrobiia bacterium]NNL71594.1 nitroreductase family deazaflavin-dependent oxidoreductase [Acidimicrobiia bacterium]
MTEPEAVALRTDRTIDITTRGRRSDRPSRIEIWFHNIDGRVYITGLPGSRDWYANLLAEPHFTFHLKESVVADLDAVAHPVTDQDERRAVFEVLLARLGHTDRMDAWMDRSPLVEVTFPT